MKLSVIAVLCAAFLLAAGCGGPRWEYAVVEESRNQIIRIQHTLEDSRIEAQGYRHPADVDPEAMAFFLGELSYLERELPVIGERKKTPVFQDGEIGRLAPALSRALREADEDGRVAFTSFNTGGGLVFERRRRTDGVVFVDPENRINIAFSWINTELPTDDLEAAALGEPPDNPLVIKEARTPLKTDGSAIHPAMREDGRPYPMWVMADLSGLEAAVPDMAGPEPDSQPEKGHREAIRSQLEYLRDLHEDGLIGDEEYEEKRKELIDAIR